MNLAHADDRLELSAVSAPVGLLEVYEKVEFGRSEP